MITLLNKQPWIVAIVVLVVAGIGASLYLSAQLTFSTAPVGHDSGRDSYFKQTEPAQPLWGP